MRIKPELSDKHFASRSKEKNLLAIISDQSSEIESYDELVKKYSDYENSTQSIINRPSYWGGFSFQPYSFEFWKGNDFRLNKRSLYQKNKENWDYYLLEP